MIPKEIQRMKPLTGQERLGQNRESEYLGAEDFFPDDAEPVLTIAALYSGAVTLQRGKEVKDVIVFKEDSVPGIRNVRPLIVNATNRKTLRRMYRSVTAETLVGKRVQLYIDHNVRDPSDGSKTDGIRIRPEIPAAPQAEKPIPCEDCGKPLAAAWGMKPATLAEYARQHTGKVRCKNCIGKYADMQAAETAEPVPEAANGTDEG